MKELHLTIFSAVLLMMGLAPLFAGSQGQYPAYSGNKRMAVIMLAWQDKACPDTRQNVVNKIWNNSQSLRKYYLDMSRNIMDFALPADAAPDGTVPATTSSVYGPYTLTIAEGFDKDITYANVESYYGSPGSVYLSGTHSVARDLAAARDGFNASNYDYIMYVTPKGPSTGSVGGYAGVDATYSHLYVMKQNYINHELGHNLGLAHSNTTVDKDGYGSQDCVMGNQNNPHLDSVHTYNQGWYPDASFSIKSYGQYTIENLAQPDTDNVKVLRFDRAAHGATSNSTYNVWVSYRVKGIGQDIGLNTNWDKKVNIHYCKADSNRPSDPGGFYSRYYTNNNVTKFLTGGSYTDPDNLCEVRYLREDSSGNASAVVQLIDPSGNQPPSIPAGQIIAMSPGTSDFTIQANDPEDDTLTYTIVSAPTEGTLDVSGGTFTYTSTASGDYSFTVRANDGQYDSFDEVVTMSIVGVTPPTADAGPDQTIAIQTGVPWTPAEITTKVWLDANDAGTITLSGSTVSQWNDKSGNNNHAYQEAAGSQPTYDGTNNKLVFDGNDIFKVTNDPFKGLQNFAVISLQRWNAASSWKNAAASYHGEGSNGWQLRQRSSSYGKLTFTRRSTGGVDDPDPSTSDNSVNHIAVGLRKNSQDVVIRHNGAQTFSASNDTGSIGYSGSNRSAIGGRFHSDAWGTPSGHLNGDLMEVIIIENATDEDVLKAEGYLAHKWGVEGSLPAGHDYKSAPPGGTGAVANLAGVVNDADNDPLTTSWSVVSGPAEVTFGNATMPATTAFFTVAGTYVLRLSTTDGLTAVSDDVTIIVNPDGGIPIVDVDLPAGISLYGYTGQGPINAQAAFQALIENNQLSLVRWVDPSGSIKELYFTTFPSAGWVNEIGDLTLGQGYVVKTTTACTLSIIGNKDTGNVSNDLPAGYSIIGFNKETPMDAMSAFQSLIDAGRLELVRWVDPSSGGIKELYYTTFPSAGWVNEIGNLTEGQGYIIKLNAPHTGFSIP